MNILVLPGDRGEFDSSIEVGRSLARVTGGSWRILRTVGWRQGLLPGFRNKAVHALEAMAYAADLGAPLSGHRVVWRSLVPAVERELALAPADLVVLPADQVLEPRRSWSFDELVEAIGGPILAVRGEPAVPPARISIVTDGRDLEFDVLRTALEWLEPLKRSTADHHPIEPLFEIQLVHGIRAVFDWAEAKAALAAQLSDWSDDPEVIFRSIRPELLANLPRVVSRLESDLTVVFMDRRGSLGFPRLGKLARTILNQNSGSVLLLPPLRFAESASAPSEPKAGAEHLRSERIRVAAT